MLTLSLIAMFFLFRTLSDEPGVEAIQTANSKNTQKTIPGRKLDTNKNIQLDKISSEKYIYKWRDKNNTIIISSERPPSGITAEAYPYMENEFSTSEKSITNTAGKTKPISVRKINNNDSIVDNPLQVYTPNGLRELIQYSKDIGEQIELRGELLDDLSEQL